LIAVFPHDRDGRFEADTNPAPLIDKGAFGRDAPHYFFGRQHG
jgi:hypothetical protein